MSFELQACSDAGQKIVATVVELTGELREQGVAADRSNSMCEGNIRTLQANGIAAAFVPEELSGGGLNSVQDWLALMATLGIGDASAAIAINMHLGVTRGMSLAYLAAKERDRDTKALAQPLKAVVAGKMLICATATEAGTDNLHPLTEAQPTEQGWEISGRKRFVTMSPMATHLAMNLRLQDDEGDFLATTMLPMDSPGLIPQNDWDALGMRGSGSQSIVFDKVPVGHGGVRKLGAWGRWSPEILMNRTLGNLTLVAVFLGVAEHAYEVALGTLGKQKRLGKPVREQPGIQTMVGEMEITLATCQSLLAQAGVRVDTLLHNLQGKPPTLSEAHELMKDYQCVKAVVNQSAINLVSQAMDVSGGGGFAAGQPLAQLYRDVRAGPFMQPFAPAEQRTYIGRVALGDFPES